MQCPKCNSAMATKTYGRLITVNRCTNCAGLFVMPDALSEMKEEWMSEMLDPGDAKTGREFDRIENIACPSCFTQMNTITDAKQTHIRYETCPGCGGYFFDAGEFTDWKQETTSDYFKDFLARFRRR